jgi:hyaluronan synthase
MSRLQSPPEAPVRSTSARFVHGAEGGGSARGDIATRTAVPASVARPPSRAEKSAGALVVLGATLVLAYVLTSGRFAHRYTLWPRTQWGNAYWICALAWGGLMYAVLVWRVVLWRRYRPMADVPERRLPSVSVIIPAFNEGPLVCDSIRSAAQSDYPAERLEIIVIDDGSTDDTWANILPRRWRSIASG